MKMVSAVVTFIILNTLTVSGQQWITTGSDIYNINTGNVGIGKTNPSNKLEVLGNSQSLLTVLQVSNAISGLTAAGNGAALSLGYPGGMYSTKIATVYEQNNPSYLNPALGFYTMYNTYLSGTEVERMRISSIGNVGIGTSAPANLLHVSSSSSGEIDVAKFQNVNSAGFVGVQIDRSLNARYALLKYSTNGSNDWMVGTAYDGGISNSAYSIGTGVSLSDARLTILTDGKVGIGNTAPFAKLDVSGNIYCRNTLYIGTPDAVTTPTQISGYALAVNGTAIFNRAKVKLYGNWPDYVFDDKYNLLPLPEVEKFLKINKHLPEVPSAAEIEKDGIDLGDNQSKLLKKIEELTLYMIEQNKKMEAQSAEISSLQKQINGLQKNQ